MTELDLETVAFERHGDVALVALDRPDKRNAVNARMHADLHAVMGALRRDRDVRAVVLSGRGAAFCAGQDLSEFGMARADESFRVDEHVRDTFNRLVLGLRELELPVIAGVDGVAAGAGFSLALAADLRIAGADASFLQAFVKIGLLPDTGSTHLLPELVGPAVALELMMTGDAIDAERARELGIVNRVVEAGTAEQAALELATRLAAMPTRAIALTKRAVYRARRRTLEDALEYEAQLQQRAVETHDHQEGVMAFLEKRDPVFTGR